MQKDLFDIPILFLIFNRPDTTKIVFERIREIKPKVLFVSADGPRESKLNENLLCEQTRAIINSVDWDCEVKTNFSSINLGCKKAVSSAITWFFNNVESGIILEDDCVPDLSFFQFCKTLLDKYKYDERIMHIGGTNFQDGKIRGNGSYYFSRISHVWGWATWKRAWNLYDVNIKDLPDFINENVLKNIFTSPRMQQYYLRDFKMVYNQQKDTWDYQWSYTVIKNNGLSIIPNKNLVTNIGFSENATHTVYRTELAERKAESINEIIHPKFFYSDKEADLYTFNKYMGISKFKKLMNLLKN